MLVFDSWRGVPVASLLSGSREPSAIAGIPGFPTVFCRSCWSLIRGVPVASLFSRSREPSALAGIPGFPTVFCRSCCLVLDSWVPNGASSRFRFRSTASYFLKPGEPPPRHTLNSCFFGFSWPSEPSARYYVID